MQEQFPELVHLLSAKRCQPQVERQGLQRGGWALVELTADTCVSMTADTYVGHTGIYARHTQQRVGHTQHRVGHTQRRAEHTLAEEFPELVHLLRAKRCQAEVERQGLQRDW